MGKILNKAKESRILRINDVMERTGISRSSIYDKMKMESRYYDASFPKSIKLGKSAVGWLESDVEAWIASRADISEIGSLTSSKIPPLPTERHPDVCESPPIAANAESVGIAESGLASTPVLDAKPVDSIVKKVRARRKGIWMTRSGQVIIDSEN